MARPLQFPRQTERLVKVPSPSPSRVLASFSVFFSPEPEGKPTLRYPILLLLILLSPMRALACEPVALSLTTGVSQTNENIQVSFTLDGNELVANFDIKAKERNERAKFLPGQYPYQFDVVEVFVSVNGGLPYYEFELTPLGQILEVKILDPRKPFVTGLKLGLQSSVQNTTEGWTAEMRIPLERIGWKGGKITGNAFAILGKNPQRRFYSLSLPPQDKARFHLPQYFVPLAACEP